jgi:hypothetical protein
LQDSVKVQALYVLILGNPCYVELKLPSPAKAKEKALKALFARKLMERGWLSAPLHKHGSYRFFLKERV